MLAHCTDCHEHGDGRTPLACSPIADDEDVCSTSCRALRGTTQPGERRLQTIHSLCRIPYRVEGNGRKAGDIPESTHLFGKQDRVLQPEHARIGRPFEQGRPSTAEVHT